MSPEPIELTEAERAVAEVLDSAVFDSEMTLVNDGAREDIARAVVAAVRPLLAAEALEAAAADWENQPESVSMKPDVEAWLHRRAAALRTTTPEHKGDQR